MLPEDIWITQETGSKQVRDLLGSDNKGEEKDVYLFQTFEGFSLTATEDQCVFARKNPNDLFLWYPLSALKPEMEVRLHNYSKQRGNYEVQNPLAYSQGWVAAVEALHPQCTFENFLVTFPPTQAKLYETLVRHLQVMGVDVLANSSQYRVLATDVPEVVASPHLGSWSFQFGFLEGVLAFDAKPCRFGVGILRNDKYDLLVMIQLMLLRFGVPSCIHRNAEKRRTVFAPSGSRVFLSRVHHLLLSWESLKSPVDFQSLQKFPNDEYVATVQNVLPLRTTVVYPVGPEVIDAQGFYVSQ